MSSVTQAMQQIRAHQQINDQGNSELVIEGRFSDPTFRAEGHDGFDGQEKVTFWRTGPSGAWLGQAADYVADESDPGQRDLHRVVLGFGRINDVMAAIVRNGVYAQVTTNEGDAWPQSWGETVPVEFLSATGTKLNNGDVVWHDDVKVESVQGYGSRSRTMIRDEVVSFDERAFGGKSNLNFTLQVYAPDLAGLSNDELFTAAKALDVKVRSPFIPGADGTKASPDGVAHEYPMHFIRSGLGAYGNDVQLRFTVGDPNVLAAGHESGDYPISFEIGGIEVAKTTLRWTAR